MNRNRKWKKKRKKKKDAGLKVRTDQQNLDEFVLELDRTKEMKKKKQRNESSNRREKSNEFEEECDLPNNLDQILAIDSSILLDQFEVVVQEATNLQQNRIIKIHEMGKIVKYHKNWPEVRHLGME